MSLELPKLGYSVERLHKLPFGGVVANPRGPPLGSRAANPVSVAQIVSSAPTARWRCLPAPAAGTRKWAMSSSSPPRDRGFGKPERRNTCEVDELPVIG